MRQLGYYHIRLRPVQPGSSERARLVRDAQVDAVVAVCSLEAVVAAKVADLDLFAFCAIDVVALACSAKLPELLDISLCEELFDFLLDIEEVELLDRCDLLVVLHVAPPVIQ